jgi:hypothetical protein
MIRRFGSAVVLCAAIACGGSKAPPAPATAGSSAGLVLPAPGSGSGSGAGSALAPGVESLSSTDGDGLAAAGTASAYLHALSKQDWAGACATRLRAERAKLAKKSGSCERGLEAIFAKEPLQLLGTATTRDLRKRGGTIAVDIAQPGQTQLVMTLFLQREDGLWLLVDLPDADAF